METQSPHRLLHPRIIDSDWLLLRKMRPAIEKFANAVGGPSTTAIDIGCGSQPYRSIFELRGIIYRGADFDSEDIAIEKNGKVAAADRSADIALSFQVLEHVRDVAQYLGEARRILREQGWLILSTHGNWLYHPHPEDHRRWTRQGLLAELAANGFEATECVAVLGPLAWTTVLRLTGICHFCRKIPMIGHLLANMFAFTLNVRGFIEDLVTPSSVTQNNACVYVTLSRVAEQHL